MAGPSWDDNVRLGQALKALVSSKQVVTASGRQIFTAGEGDGVSAILQEVSETILRRVLIVTNERNETLSLEVAERRIVALQSSVTRPASDLFDRTLVAEDAPLVAGLFEDFACDAQSLYVLSKLPETASMGVAIGLSIQDLVGGQADGLSSGAHGVEEMAVKVREFAVASYFEIGGVPVAWGVEALAGKLARLSASVPELDGMPNGETLWSVGSDDGLVVMRTVHGGSSFWAILPQDGLDAYLVFRAQV